MITYVPNYYSRFKCIADKCRHTCCKGWEIDVDEDSLKRYQTHPEIMEKIEDGSYILQGDEERCPFLREDNLCQMIIDHGEDFICNICKDHPRFRNYHEDYIEMGLGLCCEAVCDLVIDNRDTFELVPPKALSEAIIAMNERDVDILERFARVSGGLVLSAQESLDMYKDMECLDSSWQKVLARIDIGTNASEFIREYSIEFENIAVYYLYRYSAIPAFAVEASLFIARAAMAIGGDVIASIKAAARMYSSEVEYSDLNMDTIYDVFEEVT